MKLRAYPKVGKKLEDRVGSQNGDFNVNFLFFKEKAIFKSQLIKSKHRVISKAKADTYGALVLHLIIAPLF